MNKILVFIIGVCIIWAFTIEPDLLVVKKYRIQDKSMKGVRIGLISDLHLRENQSEKLIKIVDKVNSLNPDIVLITGDFINDPFTKDYMPESEIAKGLKNIKTNLGIYAVLGNHDCFKNETRLVSELGKVDIKVLQNSNFYIKEKKLYIAGLKDDTTRVPDINKALENTSLPRIVLMHSPDMYPQIQDKINLAVAGHNHGGQICMPVIGPLFLPAKTGRKYAYGFFDDGFKKMIVTKGIGTSSIHARFNCLPEIVLIEFY